MTRFANRTVIVTGGARGMGAGHARGFVAEGANVVIADVLAQEGRTLADTLGDQAIFSRLDVTSDRDWAATVAAAEDVFGPVSVLVNNAGIVRYGRIVDAEHASLAPGDRHQPDRHVSRNPRGGALDAQGGRRCDRQYLLDRRTERPVRARGVRGQQMGHLVGAQRAHRDARAPRRRRWSLGATASASTPSPGMSARRWRPSRTRRRSRGVRKGLRDSAYRRV